MSMYGMVSMIYACVTMCELMAGGWRRHLQSLIGSNTMGTTAQPHFNTGAGKIDGMHRRKYCRL